MKAEFVRFLERDELWAAAKAETVGGLMSEIEDVAAEFWEWLVRKKRKGGRVTPAEPR